MLYFPAYGAALALAAVQGRRTAVAAVRSPVLWALVGLTFVSMLWSIDPAVTARRSIAVLFTTLAGLAISARYDWPRLAEVLATAFAVLVAMCFAFAILAPSYGKMSALFPGSWRGVWYEKNALGDNMTLGYIVFCGAAILNPHRAWLWVGMAAAALALVLLSTSKTSLVSLLIGVAALGLAMLVRRGPATAVAATFLGVTVLIGAGIVIGFASDSVFALLGKDATLTGRTKIWTAVLSQIHTRPWTGFGYGAVWTDTGRWGPLAWITKRAGFTAVHAHNSWLETWLDLGLVGLAAWSLLFVEVWLRTLWTAYRSPAGRLALPFMAVYSLMTLTESVALVYNDFIWLMFTVLAVKLAAPRSEEPPGEARLAAPWP